MRVAKAGSLIVFIGMFCFGETAMAQTPPAPTPAEVAAAAKAQSDALKSQYEAQKAAADALKAQYDAQKAAAEAQTAADTARIKELVGTVPTSGITGEVAVKAEAGKGEATLLAAIAMQNVSSKIATQLRQVAAGNDIYVFAGTSQVQVQNWRSFLIRQNLGTQAFETARRVEEEARTAAARVRAPAEGASGTTEAALAVAGIALQALQHIGTFFQSEYEVGNAAATADEQVFAPSVIKHLLAAGLTVFDPSRLSPALANQALLGLLTPLDDANVEAPGKAAELEVLAKTARADAGAAGLGAAEKEQLENIALAYERAAATWKAAAAGYEALKKDMATPDTNGVLLATKIVQEKAISDGLDNGGLALFLKVNAAIGSYYTKKNIWTFLGGMPYSVMGGAVVSYTLVDGKTGKIVSTGVEPVHSGYHKVNDVERSINDVVNGASGTAERINDLERKIAELELKLNPGNQEE